jgi:ribonucleoside-diphosphate reductase alpha chain
MHITKIKKRDGRVVVFDRIKILRAMEAAARSVNPEADVRPFSLVVDHVIRYIELSFGSETPEVERVQDLVERTLIEHGYFEIGKAYILYRAERAKVRAQQAETEPDVHQTSLHLVEEDGSKQLVTDAYLRQRFEQAGEGLGDVDYDLLVARCQSELYDGMAVRDLDKTLVLTARAFIERDPAYSKLAARLALRNLYKEAFGVAQTARDHADSGYRQAFIDNLRFSVKQGRLVNKLLDYDLDRLAKALQPERDLEFEYLGFETLYDRYFLVEEGGERRLETPQAFWMRVAMGVALDEEQKEERAIEFYEVMSKMEYVPSSPTLFHAGTKRAQMSSCYLNTVEDKLDHIFKVYGDNAQLSKYAGGIGSDWSNIRATGAWIGDTNITSQGVIPFLRIANDVTVAINRSGRRRGATAAYLETWHYDIEDFLDLRRNTGDERRRTHDMNTANWIPDLFMKRVNENGQWTLFSPDETPELHHLYGKRFEKKYAEYEEKADRGEIKLFKRIQARDLWRKMITMLFETGHPWITWKDPSNVRSPQDHVGVVHNSNLCTEITLNTSAEETAVCNLGSVNLARHMAGGKLDADKVERTVATAMRMLDNVIDLNFYPTEEARNSNLKHRPVGLGMMGFQDALYLADLPFDSDAAVRFADQSMELISYHAILNSAKLARERGAYASFKGSKWDRGIFPIDTLDLLEQERGTPIGVMRTSALDWTPAREAVKKYGMRNSNTMAMAPTATISNITGCFPCIEPIYKNLYVKSNISGNFTVANAYLVEDLKQLGLWNETVLEEIKQHDGSIAEVSLIPPRLREKYKEVFDIDTEWLIKAAAYRGKWVDQSQSLNIFFKGSSGKRLADLYMLAWHMGLKTTYYLRTLAATSVEKSTVDLQVNRESPQIEVAEVAAALTSAEPSIEPAVAAIEEKKSDPAPVFAAAGVASISTTPASSDSASGSSPSSAQASTLSVVSTTQPATELPTVSLGGEGAPKLCLINDPDCEACQ